MQIEEFSVKCENNTVPCRLFTPEGASKEYCVLWIQGWSSSMDSHREGVERMAAASHTVFATLDYAGHGLSTVPLEETTREQQHKEAVAVFDELKNQSFKNIIVIGGSFGGYMTALLTGVRPVHTAVLRCPANYPDVEMTTQYKNTIHARDKDYASYMKGPQGDKALLNSRASDAISNYEGFTYIMEHELDEVVPAKVPRHYYKLAKHGNYLIVPKTPHSPKTTDNPAVYVIYIEHLVIAIVQAAKLQDSL